MPGIRASEHATHFQAHLGKSGRIAPAICAHAGIGDVGHHVPGARAEHDYALTEVNRFLDGMRDQHLSMAAPLPQLEQRLLQRLSQQRIDGRERLVHEQQIGVHRERTGEREPLAHTA